MQSAKRIIKNTGFLYAKMGITMFISLYTTRLILNALGSSDFGIFNVVGGAIGMLGFLHAAMSGATQRFMSYYEGKGDREKQKYIFNVSSVLHFIIAAILVAILIIAGSIFFNGILNIPTERIFAAKIIYASLILSTAFTVISVPYEAVLNAHENMLFYSIIGVIESLLKLATALTIVYYAGDKLVLYGILMATIPLISRTCMQVYCHRKYEECVIAPRKYFEKGLMKEMTGFAGWSFLGSASSMISGYGSGIVLNIFHGTILNAANGVSGQINGQMQAFSTNMLKAVSPVIVKKEGGGNRTEMYNTTFWACKMAVLIYAIFAIPFLIEADFILKLWLKNAPPYSVIFIKIIIVKVLVEQITLPLGTTIAAIGKIKQYNIVSSLLWLFYMLLIYGLFKLNFEPQSMKYAELFIAVCISAYQVFYCFRYAQMNLNDYVLKVIIKTGIVILISVTMGSVSHYFIKNEYVRLIGVIITSSIALIITFIYVDFDTDERKMFIKKTIKLLNNN